MQRYYSNIYWHFTGSPKGINWHKVFKPKDILAQGKPKDAAEAVSILKAILYSKQLRGSCTESFAKTLETDGFCCVTDIPLKDLPTHAPYYGTVCIGFNASAIHKSFLPVIYVPKTRLDFIKEIIGFEEIAGSIGYGTGFEMQQFQKYMSQAVRRADEVRASKPARFLINTIKITDFSESSEESFYREREWRHIGNFAFEPQDVAAIIAPKVWLKDIKDHINGSYPDDITFTSWEFIEKS